MTDPARAAAPQQLLLPEAVAINPDSRSELESRLPILAELGFEVEIFGENSLLFRAIPAEWGTDELRVRLRNLVDRLLDSESAPADRDARALLMDEDIFERIASEACHSAIRAGDRLDREEAERMVEQLFACAVHRRYSPYTAFSLASLPHRIFEYGLVARLTAALSTGNLDDATGSIDDIPCAHPWNCPHGRPTLVKVPKGRFEEWFQRRV